MFVDRIFKLVLPRRSWCEFALVYPDLEARSFDPLGKLHRGLAVDACMREEQTGLRQSLGRGGAHARSAVLWIG